MHNAFRQPQSDTELPVGVKRVAIGGDIRIAHDLLGRDPDRKCAIRRLGCRGTWHGGRPRWSRLHEVQVGRGDSFAAKRHERQAGGRAARRPRQPGRRVELPCCFSSFETHSQPLQHERAGSVAAVSSASASECRRCRCAGKWPRAEMDWPCRGFPRLREEMELGRGDIARASSNAVTRLVRQFSLGRAITIVALTPAEGERVAECHLSGERCRPARDRIDANVRVRFEKVYRRRGDALLQCLYRNDQFQRPCWRLAMRGRARAWSTTQGSCQGRRRTLSARPRPRSGRWRPWRFRAHPHSPLATVRRLDRPVPHSCIRPPVRRSAATGRSRRNCWRTSRSRRGFSPSKGPLLRIPESGSPRRRQATFHRVPSKTAGKDPVAATRIASQARNVVAESCASEPPTMERSSWPGSG